MPANLTPNYLAADARFRAAETTEDKLAALDEMYATIPKHKGTEKLRADIKRRISKLREKDKQSSKEGKHVDEFAVVREGAGQIVLVGPPNSGKSSLLARLTAAEPEIADHPHTTQKPQPGMMDFDDILIQLVDVPPVCGDHTERGVIGLAQHADALAVVLDCSDNSLLDSIEDIRHELSNSRTMLVVANKMDLPGADVNLAVLEEAYADEFAIHAISARTGEGLEELKVGMFHSLGIIRVYTKVPGKAPDMSWPFTLKKGSNLIDFAATVHKDFASTLRFARAWGKDVLDGARIGHDHILRDGYVIELHS